MPRNPSLDATQTSISQPRARKPWVRVLKTLVLIAALAWVGNMLREAVGDYRRGNLELHIRPGLILLSGVLVLANYCLLIRAWLFIITGLSGQSMPFLTAARIWFVSNLGALMPGRVWGIIQMGTMSTEAGISPVAAGGASIINATVNIATGMAVGAITGTQMVARSGSSQRWIWLIAALAGLGVLALPLLIPLVFRFVRRFRPDLPEVQLPHRVIALVIVANSFSWVIYGAAFLCLTRAIVDISSHSLVQHIAANATSYVAGYFAIFSPAGVGVREETLQQLMVAANMATPAEAGAVALVSRVWQLIIMVLPALIFLAYRRPLNEKDNAAG